jgi:NitT/TauT family transport system substrate-binding protein
MVDRGYPATHDLALQTLKEIPFGKRRELDPENTVRFFALRLREAGMIRSTQQQIIAQGTDWRFLNELKKELKG